MMHLIYIFYLSGFLVKATSFHLPEVPRIYPQLSDVTVDAYTDLTLGCRGVEPIRWAFLDDFNSPHYKALDEHISETINEEESEYTHESILTLYNVSHINIGFYYCHATLADFTTARRSSRIYVFIHDDDNLSVITSEEHTFMDTMWVVIIPCRPTSPDINITLTCNAYLNSVRVSMAVNPKNYTQQIYQDGEFELRFHPYYGFQVHHDDFYSLPKTCECDFRRNNKMLRTQMWRANWINGPSYITGSIEGPDIREVGDGITLQCATLQGKYFPIYRYWLLWDTPNFRNIPMAVLEKFNLNKYVLLINTITLKNISTEDEGIYKCNLKDYEQNSKYVFINESKTNFSAPHIFSPSGDEIQINSGENITLRCAGSRPVTWFFPQVNVSYSTEHLSNIKSGQYETYLHIMDVHYTNTGFYYCAQNISNVLIHPFLFTKFYIFVKDEQNLYVPLIYHITQYPYANVTVPCLPTSRDVNVYISMAYSVYDPLTNRLGPNQFIIPVIYAYDPREGFTVQFPGPNDGSLTVTCMFVTRTTRSTLDINYSIADLFHDFEPAITGPHEDFVFVGQSLQLSCIVFVPPNVPDDTLHWILPNDTSANEIVLTKGITFKEGKVVISKLMLDKVNVTNAGLYSCHLNNATANKVISVYDQFDVEPSILNLQYDYAYIGQPFALLCNVIVAHNVDIQMFWVSPNGTEIQAKVMNLEYITEVRNIHGHIILLIDNVTQGDAGNYSCSVSDFTNRRKQVTKNVVVKKGVKPTVISNFAEQEEIDVLLEGSVTLTCSAEGDPDPVITWMKDSREVRKLGEHINFSNNNSELTVQFVQKIDAGLYTCVAQNPFGRDSRTVNLRVITAPLSKWYIASVICGIILTAAVASLLIRNIYKGKKRSKALIKAGIINFKTGEIKNNNPFLNTTEPAMLLPYDTKWEIPRNKIELGRNLGSGSFGLVVEATVSNFFDEELIKTVAVKMLHPQSNFNDFNLLICELKIMTHLGKHDNLINLLGACTENIGEKKLLVVIEYCKYGNLRNYLIENRCNFVNLIDPETELICFPDTDFNNSLQAYCSNNEEAQLPCVSTLQLLHWALQVARGMEFLAASQILHGDLAARNILLADNYIAKISDFGLSKCLSFGYYKKKSQCPLPIKWMAIESIRDKIFSTQSDVWAFGVVLWELFSLARIPYAELEPDFGFYRKLESGYRLEQPVYSTREIYQVMRECWRAQPQCRPTFSNLARTLTDLQQAPSTCCLDIVNDSSSTECSSLEAHISAASVLAADPVATTTTDCVALEIITTTNTL